MKIIRPIYSYFIWPTIALVAACAVALFVGGLAAAGTVAILAILEISLSFDNATLNAGILGKWPEKWVKLFLVFGVPIAVFGMRFLFPVLIVSVFSHLSIPAVFDLVINHPKTYAADLTAVGPQVAAFGGSFLLLLGFEHFMDDEKDSHWLAWIEQPLAMCGRINQVAVGVTTLILLATTLALPAAEQLAFVIAGAAGIIAYIASRGLGTVLGGDGKTIQAGIGGFLFLELLDASMSFDGVIGAFAISTNLIWIAAGLGIGALAVRELTVLAVDRETLAEFRYLEHGAFWAILALGVFMLVGEVHPIPKAVTGLTGAVLIGFAFIASVIANRREAAALVAAPAAVA